MLVSPGLAGWVTGPTGLYSGSRSGSIERDRIAVQHRRDIVLASRSAFTLLDGLGPTSEVALLTS